MRAWDRGDEPLAQRREAADAETSRRSRRTGIELDPAAPGSHRHGDLEHPSDHEHPHAHSGRATARRRASSAPAPWDSRWGSRSSARAGRSARWPRATRPARAVPLARRRRPRLRRARRPSSTTWSSSSSPSPTTSSRRSPGRCGCMPARRSSTPAGCWARRCSTRRWRPGARRAPSTRWSRSRTSTGRSRRCPARRSRSRATRTSPRTSPRWPRRSARCRSGSPRGRRRPTTRRRCSRPAASSRCWTSIREVAAATGLDEAGALRDLPAAPRADRGQRQALGVAGALTGPATRGDAGTVTAHLAALAEHAPDARARLPRAARAIGHDRRGPWRAGTRSRQNASGPHLQPTPDAVRCGHAAQHRDPPRGVAGTVRPPAHPGARAAARPQPRSPGSQPPRRVGPCCASRPSGR